MCSSTAANSAPFSRAANAPSLLRRRFVSSPTSTRSLLRSRRCICLSASSSLSWIPDPDDSHFNGWSVARLPFTTTPPKKNPSVGATVLIGGACAGALLAAVAYFSLSSNGFRVRLRNPLVRSIMNLECRESGTSVSAENVNEEHQHVSRGASVSETLASSEKVEGVKLIVPVDSTQLEALSVLKKLKIVEDDARADELCTRREYARWLVRLNSLLERNPKHRVSQPIPLSGSTPAAFDDVGVADPDFGFIQSLAEAGIIPSKLLVAGSSFDSSKEKDSCYFYPDSLVSRKDLIDWKVQLEYGFSPELIDQISTQKIEYMDMREISLDASPEFLVDILAGDKSIIRKVFGQSRRLQPNKPLSRAQAAVALISGRMAEAVYNEMLRLEAEHISRLATMEEIKFELLERGDIERFWDDRIIEEREHRSEVEKHYTVAMEDLEAEKVIQVKAQSDQLKEKAAMDCQRQLLSRLKEEIEDMSEKLASERATYVGEQCNLQQSLTELQNEQERITDAKSILESEVEAVRILRSWVEDEARKNQARAKVLEQVLRRWNWEDESA